MKTKIPIKKYSPDQYALDCANRLLTEAKVGPGLVVASELVRLLIHHEEETKFLIKRIEELELLATD